MKKEIDFNKKETMIRVFSRLSVVVMCLCINCFPFIFAQVENVSSEVNQEKAERENALLLQGTWEVEQVTMEKNTDGRIERRANVRANDAKGFLPCPQRWEIKDSKTVILHFPDKEVEPTEYIVEGDKLTIWYLGAIMQYTFVINEDKLTLTTTYKYHWNQAAGRISSIEEKLNLTLKKQK